MSYVDALFDRDKDRIHVVERVDGRRDIVNTLLTMCFTMRILAASTRAFMVRL
jgi:hypothetical protein